MPYLDNLNYTPAQRHTLQRIAGIERGKQLERDAESARLVREANKTREAENERLAAWHRADSEKRRAAEEKAAAEQRQKTFDAELRNGFFLSNPNASEADYRLVKDDIKKRHLLDAMKNRKTLEQEFLATSQKM